MKRSNRHVHPVMLFAFHNKFSEIRFSRRIAPALDDYVEHRFHVRVRLPPKGARSICVPSSCKHISLPLTLFMSLAEIEKAVDELSPNELTKLAAYIARRDKLAWDKELEEDFSPGAKHEKALKRIDAEIDSGNFTPLP